MNVFINSLCSTLSSTSFWSIVGSVIPFLAISILFELGFNLICRIIDGIIYINGEGKKRDEELENWEWHDWEP